MTIKHQKETQSTEKSGVHLTLAITPRLIGMVLALLIITAISGIVPNALASMNAPTAYSATGTISFQGELSDGSSLVNGNYNMRFSIYDASSGGTKKWPASADYESHSTVNVTDGIFSVLLGSQGYAVDAAVFNGGGERYLQIEICETAGAGCSTFDNLGRLPISSAAYAQNLVAGSRIEGSSNYVLRVSGSANSGSVLQVDSTAADGNAAAVYGSSASSGGAAISGYNSSSGYGMYGSSSGTAVTGHSTGTSGIIYGVKGRTASPDGAGVSGFNVATSGDAIGLFGRSDSTSGAAVYGIANAGSGVNYGVWGQSGSPDGYGVYSEGNAYVNGTLEASEGIKFPDSSIQTTSAMARPGFITTTLDSAPGNVSSTSAAIGVDGLPVISYYDEPNGYLKAAHCDDIGCTSVTVTTIDSTGDAGDDSSITIGADGLPIISYYDAANDNLKAAHCSNIACTSATLATVDNSGWNIGLFTSIAIGTDGLPIISYYDISYEDLMVAHCSNTGCTSATITTLDSSGAVGSFTSIAIGADGLPVISYLDGNPNFDLKVAHCSNTACTSATYTTVDSTGDTGDYSSIKIGVDGLPVISYFDGTNSNLKVAHCTNTACTSATLTTVDSSSSASVGYSTSIAIGADGLPVIGYYDLTNDKLKVAHCSNTACTSASNIAVDGIGVYTEPFIIIGVDGLPIIMYDAPNLVAAHCSNRFCVPFARP